MALYQEFKFADHMSQRVGQALSLEYELSLTRSFSLMNIFLLLWFHFFRILIFIENVREHELFVIFLEQNLIDLGFGGRAIVKKWFGFLILII